MSKARVLQCECAIENCPCNAEVFSFFPNLDSKWQRFIGGTAFSIVLFTWIFSIFNILIFLRFVVHKAYIKAVLILVLVTLPHFLEKFKLKIEFLNILFRGLLFSVHNWTGPCIIIDESGCDDTKCLYSMHPHGIFSISMTYFTRYMFKRRGKILVADILYWFCPLIRLMFESCVALGGSKRKTVEKYFEKEESPLFLIPGGLEEASIHVWGEDRVFLKKRYGFIRMCMKYGYKIKPVFAFGESISYLQYKNYLNLRLYLNRYGIPGIFCWGKNLLFPWLPITTPYMIVIGKPMNFSKRTKIDQDELDLYHTKYIESLNTLYNKYLPYYIERFGKNKNVELYISSKPKLKIF